MNTTTQNTKVLAMVLKGYPRISETFISNEISLLESRGFTIHLLSMRKPREAFSHKSVKEIKARVDYLPSTFQGNWLRLFKAAFKAARLYPSGTRNAFKLTLRRFRRSHKSATFKHFFQACYIAAEILPDSGVTHLHAHFAHSPTSVTMFASRITGLPFSFTGHAKDIWTQPPAQLAEKLGQARFAVTCTRNNTKYLASLNKECTPHCVYHGIDLSLFSPNGRAPETKPPYRILTVARLTGKKGLPTVFKALRLLREQGMEFSYCLIGDGDRRDELLSQLKEQKIDDITQWLGTQPHEEVVHQFEQADAFVLGCRVMDNGDRDGIPNVMVESMAMHVPVVGTTVSGLPELVDHEKSGLLVPPDDPQAMAEALKKTLTDQEYRKKIIPAAHAKVHREFDNKALILELAKIYEQHGLGPQAQ